MREERTIFKACLEKTRGEARPTGATGTQTRDAERPAGATGTQNVSRETFADFEHWHSLLTRWNPKINLVSPSTLQGFWLRHALDSWQLVDLVPDTAINGLDMGSGAGFPGLALAIAAKHKILPHLHSITLVESNTKKSNFLRTVIRELNVPAEVQTERLEKVRKAGVDFLSARALAPLDRLLEISFTVAGVDKFSETPQKPAPVLIFPKGKTWEIEVKAARKHYEFDLDAIPSQTNPDARILRLNNARFKGKDKQ